MTRYSVQPRDRIYVKRYGCLSFPKNVSKNLILKYSQTPPDLAKQSATDNLNCFEKKIKKTAEAIGDLIGNKIAKNITKVSKP